MRSFDDEVNLLRDYAEDMEKMSLDELVDRIEQEEEDEYYRSLGPRAFGPDADVDVGYPWER